MQEDHPPSHLRYPQSKPCDHNHCRNELRAGWWDCDRKSNFWKRSTIPQTLEGLFSAVSTPIFASKYALETAWRDLQIPHSSRDLNFQNFAKNPDFFILSFVIFSKNLSKTTQNDFWCGPGYDSVSYSNLQISKKPPWWPFCPTRLYLWDDICKKLIFSFVGKGQKVTSEDEKSVFIGIHVAYRPNILDSVQITYLSPFLIYRSLIWVESTDLQKFKNQRFLSYFRLFFTRKSSRKN